MDIQEQRQDSVIVLGPVGRLDSLSCREFEGRLLGALSESGAVVVDCAALEYVSSAGLMSLHTVVKIFAGHSVQPKDGGRPYFRAINKDQDGPMRAHVKLLSPQPAVEQVLEMVGLKLFFDIHTDLETALKSY